MGRAARLGSGHLQAASPAKRIGPLIRNLRRATDPLFRRVGWTWTRGEGMSDRPPGLAQFLSASSLPPPPTHSRKGGPASAPHPIEIRRGCASFAFGSVSVSTPSSSCALIRS